MKNGSSAEDYRIVYGNSDRGSSKLIWGVLSVMGSMIVSEAAWLGSRFVDLSNQVAALDAKVTILLTEKYGEKKP